MANDEVLRIQVDSSQAIGALASVQQEIKDLEKELETLNSTTGVTNAELEGTAKRLEEARGKFDDLSKTVAENAEAPVILRQDAVASLSIGVERLLDEVEDMPETGAADDTDA